MVGQESTSGAHYNIFNMGFSTSGARLSKSTVPHKSTKVMVCVSESTVPHKKHQGRPGPGFRYVWSVEDSVRTTE